jgi:hypothetical protein
LLDEHGKVLGVTCGFRDDGQNLNFAVASDRVRELMDLGEACTQKEGSPRWWIAQALRQLSVGEPGAGDQAMCLEISEAARGENELALETLARKKADRLPGGVAMDETEHAKLTECTNYLDAGDLGGACRAASHIQETTTRGRAVGLICQYLAGKMSPRELLEWIENQEGPCEIKARACLGAVGAP